MIPFSVFYVFYEQYLSMWHDVLKSMMVSLVTVFVVTFVMFGFDIFSSLTILLIIFMILIDMGGLMYYWDVSLNAVSLVNLVMVRILLLVLPFLF